MAQGTWDDFTSKYGFNDGAQTEDRDFHARDRLVKILNDRPEMKDAGIMAVAYDRPGFHNACLVVLVKRVEGKSAAQLLKEYFAGNDPEPELPSSIEDEIDELIAKAYSRLRIPVGVGSE